MRIMDRCFSLLPATPSACCLSNVEALREMPVYSSRISDSSRAAVCDRR